MFLIPFLASPLGKFVSWVVVIGVVIATILIGVKLHDNRIRNEATLQYNNLQQQHDLEAQQTFIKNSQRLEALRQDSIHQLNQLQEQDNQTIADLKNKLRSPAYIKHDRGSSFVLKQTFKTLENLK